MAPQKHTYSIILAAVPRLRADQRWGPRLSNKWLPAETWVKAIEQARLINVDLHIDAGKFNKAMACEICTWRISMLDFERTNNSGFFQVTYKGYKYYYATESGKDVPYPVPLDAKWKEKADEAGAQALIIPVTRSRPAGRDVNDDDDVTQANKKRKSTMDWKSSEAANFFNNNDKKNRELVYTTPASFYRSLDQ